MEDFNQLEELSDSKKVQACFSKFIQQYGHALSVIDAGISEVDKAEFTTRLMECLDWDDGVWKSWDVSVTAQALECIRIVSRETTACDDVFTDDGLSCLLKHARLHKSQLGYMDTPQTREALKCLANMLLLEQETRVTLVYKGGFNKIIKAMEEENLSVDTVFLMCRILFLVTVNNKGIVDRLIDTLGGGPLMHKHFAKTLNSITNDDIRQPSTVDISKPIATSSKIMVINEILKVLYNCSSRSAPEQSSTSMLNLLRSQSRLSVVSTDDKAPKDDVKVKLYEPLKEFIPDIIRVLMIFPLNPVPLSPPHSHAINALMNFPVSPESWRNQLWFPNEQFAFIDRLLRILEVTVLQNFPDEIKTVDDAGSRRMVSGVSFDQAVTPILVLLTNLAEHDMRARAVIKKTLTPEDM